MKTTTSIPFPECICSGSNLGKCLDMNMLILKHRYGCHHIKGSQKQGIIEKHTGEKKNKS